MKIFGDFSKYHKIVEVYAKIAKGMGDRDSNKTLFIDSISYLKTDEKR